MVPAGRGTDTLARYSLCRAAWRALQCPTTGAQSERASPCQLTKVATSRGTHTNPLATSPIPPPATRANTTTQTAVPAERQRAADSPSRSPRLERWAKRTGAGPSGGTADTGPAAHVSPDPAARWRPAGTHPPAGDFPLGGPLGGAVDGGESMVGKSMVGKSMAGRLGRLRTTPRRCGRSPCRPPSWRRRRAAGRDPGGSDRSGRGCSRAGGGATGGGADAA